MKTKISPFLLPLKKDSIPFKLFPWFPGDEFPSFSLAPKQNCSHVAAVVEPCCNSSPAFAYSGFFLAEKWAVVVHCCQLDISANHFNPNIVSNEQTFKKKTSLKYCHISKKI